MFKAGEEIVRCDITNVALTTTARTSRSASISGADGRGVAQTARKAMRQSVGPFASGLR